MRPAWLFLCCAALLPLAPADEAPRRYRLRGGAEVTGHLLKENESHLWVDIGLEVLKFPRDAVVEQVEMLPASPPAAVTSEEGDLPSPAPAAGPRTVEAWVEELGRGVVEIRSRAGQGSGFILNPRGLILTNHHVIAGDRELTVTVFEQADGELKKIRYENIRILALDPERDLALLQIEDPLESPLKWLPVGSSEGMRTGEPVFAIGSPLGLDRTVSRGIVSLAERLVGSRIFLQTTAQINPGNSGGPLFNLRGEVVGVNTLKFVSTGIEGVGFAIPAESVKLFLAKRSAYAFDPGNPNTGVRYLNPPRKSEW